ncbi:MAG: peptidoglycan DD-metalloendopeptidase family protein [Cyanobacteria bacterium J06635_10]
MKRALKKKMKAVLESDINTDDASIEHSSFVTPQVKHRMPKAAMIGLAISMGATSLFVTRQSDQALAAEPVGNQNTASTIPAASDEVKFVPKRKRLYKAISNGIGATTPAVVLEPTIISPVKGLGAKWQVASSLKSAQFATQVPGTSVPAAKNNTIYSLPQAAKRKVFPKASTKGNQSQNISFVTAPQRVEASEVVSTTNTQLEAQQKFALNRLKQKSNRLKASLNKLRSTPVENAKQAVAKTQSNTQVEETSTVVSANQTAKTASQNKLVSRLKQNTSVEQVQSTVTVPTPVTPTVTAPSAIAAAYEVKSGDTLAKIAGNYGTSVSELAKANNLSNPNQLKVSQQLIVPHAQKQDNVVAFAESGIVKGEQSISTTVDSDKAENSFGVGGATPVPSIFKEVQLADRRNALAKNVSRNERLRSLKEEIERLRKKYRNQQSGTVVPRTNQNTNSVEIPVSRPESASIPIPVTRPTTGKASIPISVSRPNTAAVPIQVPTPNRDVNPNFSRRRVRVANPPASFNPRSQSSSVVERKVSTQLPPLAAVDRYLPKPIDELKPPSKGFIWPAKGVFTSGFGPRWGRMHKGIDIAAPTGTPINAAADGIVVSAGWNRGGYGKLVDIRHPDGTLTRYAHNSKILVRKGQQVQQGQRISLMGSTGFSTGPHLHFEIRKGGTKAVNPVALLPPRKKR